MDRKISVTVTLRSDQVEWMDELGKNNSEIAREALDHYREDADE